MSEASTEVACLHHEDLRAKLVQKVETHTSQQEKIAANQKKYYQHEVTCDIHHA
jgi:hypothetical protein